MKKFFRIGIVALLFGIILFVSGMTMLDWDFLELDTEEFVQKEYLFDGDVGQLDTLDIRIENTKIKIVRGDTLKIIYYESNRTGEAKINTTGSEFSFSLKYLNKFYFTMFNGIKRSFYNSEIHIPSDILISLNLETKNSDILALNSGEYSKINLKTTNSEITLSEVTVHGSVNLKSTNGKITLTKASVQNEIKLESTNGKINISESSASNIIVKTTNGTVTVNETTCDVLNLKSTNGKIKLSDILASKIDANTTNDSINAIRVVATEKLSLISTNDPIIINKIQSPNIYLKTTNDSISGSIVGINDYTVKASTSNASKNLQNKTSDTDKKLEVRTSNGKINVTFDGSEVQTIF